VSAIADIEHRKMLQYLSVFKLPHGNAVFGERRLPHKNRDSYVFGSLGFFFSAPPREIFL
jgi:hypothetical protein